MLLAAIWHLAAQDVERPRRVVQDFQSGLDDAALHSASSSRGKPPSMKDSSRLRQRFHVITATTVESVP